MLTTRPSPSPPTASGRLSGPLGSAAGFIGGILGTIGAHLIGAGDLPLVALALMTVVVALIGAFTTVCGALAAASQCWAFADGFVVHRFGEISLDARGWQSLLFLLAVALLVAGAGSAGRSVTRPGPPHRGGSADPTRRPAEGRAGVRGNGTALVGSGVRDA